MGFSLGAFFACRLAGRGASGPDELVEVVFTSGTTGEPKGVMITNRNLLANIRGIGGLIQIHPHYRLVSLLPLSHLFEQIALIVVAGSGAKVVCVPQARHTSSSSVAWTVKTTSSPHQAQSSSTFMLRSLGTLRDI